MNEETTTQGITERTKLSYRRTIKNKIKTQEKSTDRIKHKTKNTWH